MLWMTVHNYCQHYIVGIVHRKITKDVFFFLNLTCMLSSGAKCEDRTTAELVRNECDMHEFSCQWRHTCPVLPQLFSYIPGILCNLVELK